MICSDCESQKDCCEACSKQSKQYSNLHSVNTRLFQMSLNKLTCKPKSQDNETRLQKTRIRWGTIEAFCSTSKTSQPYIGLSSWSNGLLLRWRPEIPEAGAIRKTRDADHEAFDLDVRP